MKTIYWNIRGVGNHDSRLALGELYRVHGPSLVFLAEPMVSLSSVPSWFWTHLRITNHYTNNRGSLLPNLWALWGADIDFVVRYDSSQCLVLEYLCNNKKIYIAGIYASTNYLHRRQLWAELSGLQNFYVAPWIFVGDFNAILGAHEKSGRRLPPTISCNDFLGWTNVNLLLHLDTFGALYTWYNGRLNSDSIALRLDRAICNEAWTDFWGTTTCTAQVRIHSDHNPLLLQMDCNLHKKRSSFKFFKVWTTHEDCRRLVLETWNKAVVGNGMHRLQQKLVRVKEAFKVWNKSIFGDVHRQLDLASMEVTRIQHLIDEYGIDDDLHAQELQAQLLLTKALNCQDQLLREKAKHQRFLYGDRNSAYFHRLAKIKASFQQISMLMLGEVQLTEPSDIENHVLEYF
jgi:hypothetical protein